MTKIGTYLLKYLVRKVSFDIKTGHKLDSVKFLRMNPKTFNYVRVDFPYKKIFM